MPQSYLNSKDRINIGYIGLGEHSQNQLLPSLKLNPSFNLNILSSRDKNKLYRLAQQYEPELVTTKWQDVVDPNLVDAVIVVATPQIHIEVVRQCLAKGIHCFVEKPVAPNLAELIKLRKLSEESRSILFVNYSINFSSSLQELRSRLDQSELISGQIDFNFRNIEKPLWDCETVYETFLYKMLVHPLFILYKDFGLFSDIKILESRVDGNKFTEKIRISFVSGKEVILNWGNNQSQLSFRYELTNEAGENGICEDLNRFTFRSSRNSNKIVRYQNHILSSGYSNSGHSKSLQLFYDAVQNNSYSVSGIPESIAIYEILEKIKLQAK
jgi:phthalate 4,5-cis-dihydrodiol dehydrogenase